MNTSNAKPTITSKYKITVPTDKFYSTPCVFKVHFGKKFLIWKGKSMLQSAEALSVQIDRHLRKGEIEDTDYLYYVVTYIKRARVMEGRVERIGNEFHNDNLKLLQLEQKYLDENMENELCLNNNIMAYIPKWVGVTVENEFKKWYEKRRKK